jgi:hypothetical protein
VRNAFAHAKMPINFDTEQIVDACDLLRKPEIVSESIFSEVIHEEAWAEAKTVRKKFTAICNIMAVNFADYAHLAAGTRILTSEHKTNERLQILVRPKPLP